jgi:hypothetical protein
MSGYSNKVDELDQAQFILDQIDARWPGGARRP